MGSFQYAAPTSVADAVALLGANSSKDTKILAGGTDLIVQMRSGFKTPDFVVDIKKIPEATSFDLTESGLRLGAAVSGATVTAHPELHDAYPGICEALDLIGSTQVQGRCSIGGNLCNGGPAADTTPSLIAANAQCVIAGPNGTRTVAVEDFVTGPGRTVLAKDEFLVEFLIPKPMPKQSDAYLRFIPRNEMDIAVVGSAANLTLDDSGTITAARVAIGAVGPKAILVPAAGDALVGTKLDDAALQAAGEAASAAASPINDKRGTVEFRIKVTGVLTRRAATIAYQRAQGRG